MNEIIIIDKSIPDKAFTFEGSVIYKGYLINLFLDDYGQCWHIQYEKDGDLIDESCGMYEDWRHYIRWRFRKE